MKSKQSAIRMVMRTSSPLRCKETPHSQMKMFCASCAFQHHAFKDVGSVFRFVSGGFQDFIQLFELDERNGVLFFFEQNSNGGAGNAVGFIFQAIDLDAVLQHVVTLLTQAGQRVSELVRLLDYDFRQHGGGFGRGGDLVHDQADAGGVDEVEDVVERGGQAVNVFAIERGNEGLVELGEDVMGHVVTAVLNVLELADAVVDVVEVLEGLLEQAGAVAEVAGHFGEHVKEFGVSGNEANHADGTLLRDSVNERLKATENYRTRWMIWSNTVDWQIES